MPMVSAGERRLGKSRRRRGVYRTRKRVLPFVWRPREALVLPLTSRLCRVEAAICVRLPLSQCGVRDTTVKSA